MSWIKRYSWLLPFQYLLGSLSLLSIVGFLIDPENKLFALSHAIFGYWDWILSWLFWPVAKLFFIFKIPFEVTEFERHVFVVTIALIVPGYAAGTLNISRNLSATKPIILKTIFIVGIVFYCLLASGFLLLACLMLITVDTLQEYQATTIVFGLGLGLAMTAVYRRKFFAILFPIIALVVTLEFLYRLDVTNIDQFLTNAIESEKTLKKFEGFAESDKN